MMRGIAKSYSEVADDAGRCGELESFGYQSFTLPLIFLLNWGSGKENVMSELCQKHKQTCCVFPQCQNVLNNNKFTNYVNLVNSPSTTDIT
jgi:hypothetical protein